MNSERRPGGGPAGSADVLTRAARPPDLVVRYGDDPDQVADVHVPEAATHRSWTGERAPLAIFLHGGFWRAEYGREHTGPLAEALTGAGFVVCAPEYRRSGQPGGGWPGTFVDVANATDALRPIAAKSRLDLKRVYAAGHSAGGQLALWLASRAKLPESSELYRKDPLAIRGVLGLAAITNLEKYRIGPPNSCHSSVEPLLGGGPDKVPLRYAETSPSQRLPLGVPQIFIQGENDPIVDAASVQEYVDAAKKAGDHAIILPLPGAGHFETSVPLPQTESAFEEALRLLLKPAT